MPSLKLTYFPFEGIAEKVRLAFAVTETPFEDFRVPREEWPNLKETTPFGQIPVLEITEDDGKTKALAESGAMLRYIARRFDKTGTLYPIDPESLAEVEEMLHLADDLWREVLPLFLMKNGKQFKFGLPADWKEKDEVMSTLANHLATVEFPKYMKSFTARLEKTGGYVCFADQMTIADLQWLPICRLFESQGMGTLPAGLMDPFPVVKAWMNKMYENPQIRKWYEL
mmetsp:Transcript_72187/g.157386  ORF Transcript_72187/g.157386 Transcript_72187/m.157386 type:complete len:227 (+) Transcript_72187:131-811(+)